METVGYAALQVIPSVKGMQGNLASQLNASGKQSGAAFSSGFGTTLKRTAVAVGGFFVADRLAAFAGSAINAGATFEQTMNTVGAATDTTGKRLEKMSAVAKTAGTDLGFTATDTADAMLELGKAGIKTGDIMGGALAGTLLTAAAGGTDLGTASTIAANAMSAFNLKGKDMGRIAAALAGGANASTASVESLGMALSQVGPGAVNAGLSLNDTIGVLAAFDQAGIKGSDAGTSLKTMLARLVPTTKKASDEMARLGLNFVNADGSFQSITQVSQQLQDRLGGLSQAERTTALSTIFGSDATRAATVLMKNGADGIAGYIKATQDKNAAEAMAATRTQGMAGAMARMRAAVESAKITMAQGLAPVITGVALGFASAIPKIVSGVRSVRDWFVAELLPAFKDAGAIISTAFVPAVDRVRTALASVGGEGGSAATTIGQALSSAVRVAAQMIGQLITVTSHLTVFLIEHRTAVQRIAVVVLSAVAAYKVYKATMATVTAVTRTYKATLAGVKAAQQAYTLGTYGMRSGQKGVIAGLSNLTGRLRASIAAMGAWTAATARNLAMNAKWQLMLAKQSLTNVVASLRRGVVAMAAWTAAQARAAAAATAAAARSSAAWVANTATMLAARAAALAVAAGQAIMRGAVLAATAAQWALNAAMTANPVGLVVVAIAALVAAFVIAWKNSDTFRKVVTSSFNLIKSVVTKAVSFVVGFVRKHWPLLLTIIAGPLGLVVALVIKNWDKVKSITSTAWNAIKSVMSKVWEGIKVVVLTYVNILRTVITTWVTVVRTIITTAWHAIRTVTSTVWNGVKSAISTVVGNVVRIVTGLKGRVMGAFKGALTWLTTVGSDIISGLIEGIKSKAGDIVGAIKSYVTDKIPGWVKKPLGIASPSKVMKAIGKWIPVGLAHGIRGSADEVGKALDSVVDRINDRMDTAIDKLADRIYVARIKARKRIAAANAATRGTKGDRDLPGSITKTEAEKMARARLKVEAEAAKAAVALVKAQEKVTKSVWRGRSAGAATDRILASLNRNGGIKQAAKIESLTLADLAKARDVLANRLKKAKDKLADAIAVRDDFKKSVVDSVKSFTSLLNAQAQEDAAGVKQKLLASDIIATMRERLEKVRQFATNMARLLSMGLSQSVYAELVAAGPEAAGEHAAALAAGGQTAVDQVNGLTTEIDKAANNLGTTSSTTLYQAGVDAAQGLVKGIESQIDKINKAAKKIAEALAKAIKKALGISSPSKVAAALGRWVPAGLAVGMTAVGQLRRVTAAGATVAAAAAAGVRGGVGSGYAIHVDPPSPSLPYVPGPGDGPAGPPPAGGGAGVVIHQTINNPQAEPTSKTVDQAARTLGMVGAL